MGFTISCECKIDWDHLVLCSWIIYDVGRFTHLIFENFDLILQRHVDFCLTLFESSCKLPRYIAFIDGKYALYKES